MPNGGKAETQTHCQARVQETMRLLEERPVDRATKAGVVDAHSLDQNVVSGLAIADWTVCGTSG